MRSTSRLIISTPDAVSGSPNTAAESTEGCRTRGSIPTNRSHYDQAV